MHLKTRQAGQRKAKLGNARQPRSGQHKARQCSRRGKAEKRKVKQDKFQDFNKVKEIVVFPDLATNNYNPPDRANSVSVYSFFLTKRGKRLHKL